MRANLGGLQLFRTEGIISVLDRLLMILIVGYLLIQPMTSQHFKIIWFVLAQTVAYATTLCLSLFLVLRKTVTFYFRVEIKQLIPIIQKLKPYALLVLLMATYFRIDTVLLRILLPDGEVQAGIFAHAFRILDFMSNYALLFPLLLLPIFSRNLSMNQRIDGLLQLSFLLLIVPSLAGIIPSIFYRKELFSLLYNEYPAISGDIYTLLTLSYFGMCVCYTFGALLTANGNLRQLNYMAATAVVLSILLNFLLIPHFKVFGAAMANASAQLFTIVIHMVLAKKTFRLNINYKTIVKLIGYIGIMIAASMIFRYFKLHWLKSMLILTVFGLFVAMLLDLISIKGLRIILKQKEI
jgi:O-antigen/teichoic acid export membrane protein